MLWHYFKDANQFSPLGGAKLTTKPANYNSSKCLKQVQENREDWDVR